MLIIVNRFLIKCLGTAGNSLSAHNGKSFSTRDQDNDGRDRDCAKCYHGAWWYNDCHQSNLNGKYHRKLQSPHGVGVNWESWKGYHYSLMKTEMKMRPLDF